MLLLSMAMFLSLAIGGATRSVAASDEERIGFGVGYHPPAFTATDLAGHPQSLKQYAGRVLVLHFWASWCPYCRSEIPELTELSQPSWAQKGVSVLAVSVDDDLERLKEFVKKSGLPYPIVADTTLSESLADQYGVSGIPVTYVLGRDGKILFRANGAAEIVKAVERALQPAPQNHPAT